MTKLKRLDVMPNNLKLSAHKFNNIFAEFRTTASWETGNLKYSNFNVIRDRYKYHEFYNITYLMSHNPINKKFNF